MSFQIFHESVNVTVRYAHVSNHIWAPSTNKQTGIQLTNKLQQLKPRRLLRRSIPIDSNNPHIQQIHKQLKTAHLLTPTRPPQNPPVEILSHHRDLEQLQSRRLFTLTTTSFTKGTRTRTRPPIIIVVTLDSGRITKPPKMPLQTSNTLLRHPAQFSAQPVQLALDFCELIPDFAVGVSQAGLALLVVGVRFADGGEVFGRARDVD